MNIVWVTSESVPYAKTGGLADVSSALPQALSERGHQVSVVMPYYPQQMGKLNLKFAAAHPLLGVPFGNNTEWAQVRELKLSKTLTYYFIEFNKYYDRPSLYDWHGTEYNDNGPRFIFLARAAMQVILARGLNPDIIHANDWHAALCPVYLKHRLYSGYSNFKNCRSVMTIHNIGYQGVFHKNNIHYTGLGWDCFNFHCLEYYDQLNFLKAGIMTADMVSTVSPSYAEEILSPGYGFTLDPSLRHRAFQGRLRGILNGIDVSEWSPEKDKLLPATFSVKKMAGKAVCKAELQKYFNLPVNKDIPLFSTISRLAYQKGLDVFAEGLEDMLINDNSQFILVGSGERHLQDKFNWLAAKYPWKFAVYIGYAKDETSHLVEAGSDFFVMPSRYEPCGLNQMYSMRYGTLPIVRSTGGLADTVTNYNQNDPSESTGFVLWDLNPTSLNNTIRWAADTYRNNPDHIRKMRVNAMSRDFSWAHTASQYEQMYDDAHK